MKNLNFKTVLATGLILVSVLAFVPRSARMLVFKKDKEAISLKKMHFKTKIVGETPVFVTKGIDYLVSVQAENGGWGAGTHAKQHLIDATKVQVDPGTTAFAGMALLRAGNTLQEGKYHENLSKALNYLLGVVEKCSEESTKITELTGTQPQVKLGQNIDVSLCVQFFVRIKPLTEGQDDLDKRVSAAIDKCLRKIQKSQASDGSITGGSWAPVLQSAMANNALELAYNTGYKVDEDALNKARDYQKDNVDKSGNVKAERGAGIQLYSIAGSQRATAVESRKFQDMVDDAKKKGKIGKEEKISRETLKKLDNLSPEEAEKLYEAYQQNQTTSSQLRNDQVLAGFGNNGGEEFLSFMMTSESMVITGGDAWENWKDKMNNMLPKIQNQDGSWNGHHCITSPVFCTAACILALTAENDIELLTLEKGKNKDK